MYYRLFLFIFLFSIQYLYAQDSVIILNSNIPNTKGAERDPQKLVGKLNENKITDKEKFDAIFSWVTKNIRYDYGLYLSPQGASKPRIERILKYKKGICIDYAFLMDTLCEIAGIRNVSVYGYVKDDLFDVTDSIFYDNHAWNAVKLDDYWYIYDVTWSSGRYKLDFTKFSKRVIRLKDKIRNRGKKSTITFKCQKTTECDTITREISKTIISLSLKNRILLKILSFVKLKSRFYFKPDDKHYFYLTDPNVLAITHYPDNPYWSLTGKYKNFREFENDSAYYYLNDSVYLKQEKQPTSCIDCDNYFSLKPLAKEKKMKINSNKLNRRNRFIIGECDYNISSIFYSESIPENDSTNKINLIDSALYYISDAKSEWKKAGKSVLNECDFQRTKNTRKRTLLNQENKIHSDFMYSILGTIHNKTKRINDLSQKSKASLISFRTSKKRLLKIGKLNNYQTKEMSEKQKDLIKIKITKNNKEIDSLNLLISNQSLTYSAFLTQASDNVWSSIKLQDSITKIFNKGYTYRIYFSQDNYKKSIVELRKNIEKHKTNYSNDLSDKIFNISDSLGVQGISILYAIEKRNKKVFETTDLMGRLASGGVIHYDSVIQYMQLYKNKMQENICWIIGGSSKLKSVVEGYKNLTIKQKHIIDFIKAENRSEARRYIAVNKEINRRKRKFKNVANNNIRVATYRKNIISKYKRDYLKKLKAERKKNKE